MLYDNIKAICDELGLSISQLERELGFPRSSICKWNDNIPSVTKVQMVATRLNTTVERLLSETKEVTT